MNVSGILPYVQIVLSLVLITSILLQQTGASMGGAFGGDNFTAGYHTRRGFERTLFYASITTGILLALSSFLALIVR